MVNCGVLGCAFRRIGVRIRVRIRVRGGGGAGGKGGGRVCVVSVVRWNGGHIFLTSQQDRYARYHRSADLHHARRVCGYNGWITQV